MGFNMITPDAIRGALYYSVKKTLKGSTHRLEIELRGSGF